MLANILTHRFLLMLARPPRPLCHVVPLHLPMPVSLLPLPPQRRTLTALPKFDPGSIGEAYTDAVKNRDKAHAAAILASAGDLTELMYQPFCDLMYGLSTVEYVSKDPQRSWDEQVTLVGECLDAIVIKNGQFPWSSNWQNEIKVYGFFARAVGRRRQEALLPLAEALIERHQRSMEAYLAQGHAITNLHPNVVKAVQQMYNAAITMHRHITHAGPRAMELAKQIPPAILNQELCATITVVHAQIGDGPGALAVLESAVAAGVMEHKFESLVANRAVLAAYALKEPEAAIALLEEMIRLAPDMPLVQTRNMQPEHPVLEPRVFSGFMAHFSRHRKLEPALKVAALAKEAGVPMDGVAVASLVSLQYRMGNLGAALDLVYAHPELQPNMELMTYAMDILGEMGDPNAAAGLYNAAIEAHTNPAVAVVITQPFMTTAVRALGRLSGFDAAVDAFVHMAGDLGIQPPPNAVLHLTEDVDRGALSTEHVARRLAEVLRIAGTMAVTEESVAREVERHLAQHDVERAKDALFQLPKHDVPATGTAWALILNYMANRRDSAGFDHILALRPQLGSRWKLSSEDFLEAVVIKGYSRTGRHDKTIAVWDGILARGAIPSAQVQASMLDACGFLGDLAVLQRVAAQIEEASWGGTSVNTWTSAVEAYLRLGRLDLALDVGERILPLKDVQLDRKFWTTLLTVNAQRLQQFRDPSVLAFLDKHGLTPDQVRAFLASRKSPGAKQMVATTLLPPSPPTPAPPGQSPPPLVASSFIPSAVTDLEVTAPAPTVIDTRI
ncbi:hypothetical protein BC828DRAFT_397034 [Blastocladiella britannica]|nr:hypothetical protein BC828DRAFT_397034 [Blastocladiella britannica]